MREVLSVILEANFKKNVDLGWIIQIECLEAPWKHGSAYRGRWRVFCVSPDRADTQILVLRKNIEPKIILSLHGVAAFLVDMDVMVAVVPMVEGQKVEVTKDLKAITVIDDG